MVPVARLRIFAWTNPRRLPGVRCSILKTEYNWLLNFTTMPGRNCVAEIIRGSPILSDPAARDRSRSFDHERPMPDQVIVVLRNHHPNHSRRDRQEREDPDRRGQPWEPAAFAPQYQQVAREHPQEI